MDRRKKYFITLDTETTSDKTPEENQKQKIMTKFIYDIGYTIATKTSQCGSRNYLVQEIYDNEQLMKNAYFINKKPLYEKMLKNGEITKKPFAEIIKIIQQDIIDYNIASFGAYNVEFDLDALVQTTNFIYPNIFKMFFKKTTSGKNAPDTIKFVCKYIFRKNIEIVDIWTLACQTLCRQKTFQAYYKQVTEHGNIKSNAEIVYNYIKDINGFEEDHTALSDSIIETEIWQRILRNHQKLETKLAFMPFHLITKEV